MRRINPLYIVALLLGAATIAFAVLTIEPDQRSSARSGSVYDEGPGGAGALRRYFEAMGARTTTVQGDRFSPTGTRASVLFILGATEAITPQDVESIRAFVRGGGTVIVATEFGFLERPLLDAFRVTINGVAAPGEHALASVAFADPPARRISVDRAGSLSLGSTGLVLATDGRVPVAAVVREGAGALFVVSSLYPFVASGLGEVDNARFVLGLARDAFVRHEEIAFDEYHHGYHPTTDVLVLLQKTWPGRALVFSAAAVFLYLVLSGRRLGPPVPLDPRPPRSSLEYIRGFAGLVRRSGRGEIARRRLRRDLRHGIARRFGLDPETPFERMLSALAVSDRGAAVEARAVDDALGRRLREDQLLRTVRQIERLVGTTR